VNIFYVSSNEQECAQALDDKRLNKMIVETAQIISTTLREEGHLTESESLYLYKSTHKNHPCVKWASDYPYNIFWLIELLGEYLIEYYYRFDKIHKTSIIYLVVPKRICGLYNKPPILVQDKIRGIDCYNEDIIVAYRNYLNAKWATDKTEPKWTNREKPEWANYERSE